VRGGTAADDDLLHDFRVALRRLRSWLRAFDSSLGNTISLKRERHLRSIVRSTNAVRDAAVQAAWLKTHRRNLDVERRAGYDWMNARLQKQRAKASDEALAAVEKFDRIAPKLRQRVDVDIADDHDDAQAFGAALAEVIGDASDTLQTRLARIRRASDVKRAHRARIAAKRLRYIVEPVASLGKDGDSLVEDLKSLQDLFGDLHDVHVFSAQLAAESRKASRRSRDNGKDDTTSGLIHLAHRVHARGDRLYANIARKWLDGAGAPFFERARGFADELSRPA